MAKYTLSEKFSVTPQKKDDEIVIAVSDGEQTEEYNLAVGTILDALKNGKKNLENIVEYRKEKGVTISSFQDGNEGFDPHQYLLSDTQDYLDVLVADGVVLKQEES